MYSVFVVIAVLTVVTFPLLFHGEPAPSFGTFQAVRCRKPFRIYMLIPREFPPCSYKTCLVLMSLVLVLNARLIPFLV